MKRTCRAEVLLPLSLVPLAADAALRNKTSFILHKKHPLAAIRGEANLSAVDAKSVFQLIVEAPVADELPARPSLPRSRRKSLP